MSDHKGMPLEVGSNELEIIEFYIDEEGVNGGEPHRGFYGVNVIKVLEVIESPKLKASESAVNPCFMGTIPLRERILPVLDLSIWLGQSRKKSDQEVILVTEFTKRVTGFLVSGVTQIYRVGWGDVEAPSQYISSIDSNCVTGMVKLEDHFVLLLDFEKIIAELDPEYQRTLVLGHSKSDKTYRVLVAEDSSIMRQAIIAVFEHANFVVQTYNNGLEAWNHISDFKFKAEQEERPLSDFFDVIVTDVEMPQMDGYTLTKNIKSDPVLQHTPVMLFSSIITDKLRHKGETVGADDQVTKPEFDTLAERAIALIEKHNAEAAA